MSENIDDLEIPKSAIDAQIAKARRRFEREIFRDIPLSSIKGMSTKDYRTFGAVSPSIGTGEILYILISTT